MDGASGLLATQTEEQSIVIVDDVPDNLRLLTGILKDRGYKVRPAPSGARALATIRKEPPDLILLDIMMPDMDGYEVCRQLKAQDGTKDIPIIFLSALHEVFDKRLRGTTELSDAAMIGQVIGELRADHELLAGRRTELADNFAYEKILSLTQREE